MQNETSIMQDQVYTDEKRSFLSLLVEFIYHQYFSLRVYVSINSESPLVASSIRPKPAQVVVIWKIVKMTSYKKIRKKLAKNSDVLIVINM